ncbi:MAG: hypothetical protein V4734_06980 [Terriglobus sp.]
MLAPLHPTRRSESTAITGNVAVYSGIRILLRIGASASGAQASNPNALW